MLFAFSSNTAVVLIFFPIGFTVLAWSQIDFVIVFILSDTTFLLMSHHPHGNNFSQREFIIMILSDEINSVT